MSLSLDLRGRVLEAYENKEGSIRSISKRFKIGTTTFVSWLKRKRRLGIITPENQRADRVNLMKKDFSF